MLAVSRASLTHSPTNKHKKKKHKLNSPTCLCVVIILLVIILSSHSSLFNHGAMLQSFAYLVKVFRKLFHLKDESEQIFFFFSLLKQTNKHTHKYVVMSKMVFFILQTSIKKTKEKLFHKTKTSWLFYMLWKWCVWYFENDGNHKDLFIPLFLSPNSVALLRTCVFFLLLFQLLFHLY